VDFMITVTASGIAGSEARARFVGTLYGIGNLPYPADEGEGHRFTCRRCK
jgi:hypothetical protein